MDAAIATRIEPESVSTAAGPTAHRPVLALAVTLALGLAVVGYQGYHLAIATQADDVLHLETPLILAVARQITGGPGGIYGPYVDGNRQVLIHAPLYYRLAGLVAWPLAKAQIDPIHAAIAGGRLVSLAFTALLLASAWQIARLDGASRLAGLWAALLLIGSPILGSQPMAVRADVPALALQTLGVLLALRVLGVGRGAAGLALAYVAFALAFCTKQHTVGAAALTSLILLIAAARGRLRFGTVLAAHMAGLTAAGLYLGFEEWLTSGQMHRAVFALPARFRETTARTWESTAEPVIAALKMVAGLLAVGLAVLWASPRRAAGGRLDALLFGYAGVEIALAVLLCKGSTGSWVNYFGPAVVFGSIAAGRALGRIAEPGGPSGLVRLAPIGLALAVVVGLNGYYAASSASGRAAVQADIRGVLDDPSLAPALLRSQRYFVGSSNLNRLHGDPALAYDNWLYPQFEAIGEAEPRSAWLAEALADPVVIVIERVESDRPPGYVHGLPRRLDELGFALTAQVGPYAVWERPAGAIVSADPGG